MRRDVTGLLLVLVVPACGTPPAHPPVDAAVDADATPPMACRTGRAWDRSTPAYTDTTTAWALTDARGTVLATADIDGDTYADLVVMSGNFNARSDLTATPPVYNARVLLNRPRTDGSHGRMFMEATASSNFLAARDGTAGRVVSLTTFADVDNDGDLDAFTGVYVNVAAGALTDSGDRSELMVNDGHGVFALGPMSDATNSGYDTPQTTAGVFNDFDRDGNADLFVAYYYNPNSALEIGQQPQLFRGAGDGTFADVTDAHGLTLMDTMAAFATDTQNRALYGATACDVDGDGLPDLLGAAYGRQWNLLFQNSASGTFTEVGRASGEAGDMNVDYSDDQSYLCYCQANVGRCPAGLPAPIYTCPGRGWRAGYNDQPWRLNGNTFSIACGDVDNDGDIDLYTAEIHHPDVGSSSDLSELLRNDSHGATVHFTRPGRVATGLVPRSGANLDEGGLSAAMWDFDGDGLLDVYLGASDYPGQYSWLFHQKPDGTFEEVGAAAGFHHACPHGLALADFDHDGDVDVIVGSSTARDCAMQWPHGNEVHFYENAASDANWTTIRLVGRGAGGANMAAIGARVRVTTGTVTQTREVQGSWGHFDLGGELPVHFGLATSCTIDTVEVRWPDATGSVETFTNVLANYPLEIHQGEGRVRYTQP